MKHVLIAFVILLGLTVVAGVTCPSDKKILQDLRERADLGPLIGRVVINRATIVTEDYYIYKVIINQVDNSVVGYAYFGTVNICQ